MCGGQACLNGARRLLEGTVGLSAFCKRETHQYGRDFTFCDSSDGNIASYAHVSWQHKMGFCLTGLNFREWKLEV